MPPVAFTGPGLPGEIRVNVRPQLLSVTVNTFTVYTFDCTGKLLGAVREGHHYRRGLDNRMLVSRPEPPGGVRWRRRVTLSPDEARTLIEDIYAFIRQLMEAVHQRRVTLLAPETLPLTKWEEITTALRRTAAWDFDRLAADAARFQEVYAPISILPPDQYRTLVLQATLGCHWNRCTFCHFYRDRPFVIRTPEEFQAHIRAVKEYFGETLALRNALFLGDANALVIPQERLLPLFALVNKEFVFRPEGLRGSALREWKALHPLHFRGIYSFLDAFTGLKKTVADYAALREQHLRRVYIGLETGADELLRWLCKPETAAQVQEVVQRLKAAGVNVGIIVMLGLGGRQFAPVHVHETVAVLNRLPLERGDLIYYSPFVELPDTDYASRARAEGIEPLLPAEMAAQRAAIEAGLRFSGPNAPQRAVYDIREFVYY